MSKREAPRKTFGGKLSPLEFRILCCLPDWMRSTDLHRALLGKAWVPGGSFHPTVRRLRSRGLVVRRRPKGDDKRAVVYRASAKGKRALSQARRHMEGLLAESNWVSNQSRVRA